MIVSSGLALSRRSERAEGYACVQHAEAVSQSFGLGIFEQLTSASLEMIERFFLDRGAPVDHEISPFAGAAAIRLLCACRYLPSYIRRWNNPATRKSLTSAYAQLARKIVTLGG
jgi:hypothetical protein